MVERKITNDEQVKNVIREVCEYLEMAERNKDIFGNRTGERINAAFGRELCLEILHAVRADGDGGCELCKS